MICTLQWSVLEYKRHTVQVASNCPLTRYGAGCFVSPSADCLGRARVRMAQRTTVEQGSNDFNVLTAGSRRRAAGPLPGSR